MKKLLCMLLVGIMTVSMVGCGAKSSDSTTSSSTEETSSKETKKSKSSDDAALGAWKLTSVIIEGSELTVDEAVAMGDNSLVDSYLVIKSGGKVVAYSAGKSDMIDWSIDGTSMTIGVQEAELDGERILFNGTTGNQLVFSKISDDQNYIPEKE